MKNYSDQQRLHRVVAQLNRQEIDFLDKLGKDALFTTGSKLSRTCIIETLVDLMMELGIQGKGITSKEELKRHILAALEKYEAENK
jgi:hypothetical protein